MVFESLLNPIGVEKKPWVIFFYGLAYSTFAIFLADYALPDYASLGLVIFITLFFLPLFYKTMIYEESKDISDTTDEKSLLKEHSKAVLFFLFLFLSLMVSFTFWYVMFSTTTIFGMKAEHIFNSQIETINKINSPATGNAIDQFVRFFPQIFGNNVKVMIFCIIFSFIFGAGAIFILTWNSSVIGAAIGKYVMALISVATGNIGVVYLKATSCGILRYMIHGIPEILAYFVAGLAGGIISVAIINHDFGTSKFEKIIIDSAILIIISLAILFIAGILEVTLTPLIACRIAT